jgi:tetratricopeptide (TPR) repeat protein
MTGRCRTRLGVAVVGLAIALGVPAAAYGQVAPPTTRAERERAMSQPYAWITLARTHQPGRIDDALLTLAGLPPMRVRQIYDEIFLVKGLIDVAAKGQPIAQALGGRVLHIGRLAAVLGLPPDAFGLPLDPLAVARPEGEPRRLIAAVMVRVAMLHTDLLMVPPDALAAAGFDALASRQGDPSSIRLRDGQRSLVPDHGTHWHIARLAIALVLPTPRGASVAREWYLATSAFLLANRDYASGVPHLEDARKALPDDALLALYLGAAYENLAAPAVQAAIEEDGGDVRLEPRARLLQRAEEHLRAAVALDPNLPEASLRLGRVLQLTSRDDEAIEHLRRAEAALTRDDLRYAAALFLGRALESRDHLDDARSAFVRALSYAPDAQSPHLALAQLAWRVSGGADAAAQLRALAESPGADDPWWTYDTRIVADLIGRVDRLRAAVAEIRR